MWAAAALMAWSCLGGLYFFFCIHMPKLVRSLFLSSTWPLCLLYATILGCHSPISGVVVSVPGESVTDGGQLLYCR